MRKPNKGSIVITKILIKLKKYMNDKWNDEVVMRKSTFETGQSSPGLRIVPAVVHGLRGRT